MKSSNIIIIVFAIALIGVLFYTMQETESPEAYIKEIEKERADKDHFMRTSSESPFADSVELYKGLNYFPIDANFKVIADLTPVEEKKVIVLKTSDGINEEHYLPYAYASFELDGAPCKLLILEIMEEGIQRGSLFLGFGDQTSARETYGAGRYLDIKKVPGSSTITLDFNEAYNPYCAYTDKFTCPLPPIENLLSVAVNAGEKIYKK
jgi:uncharacterized protein (DUF1684 family)